MTYLNDLSQEIREINAQNGFVEVSKGDRIEVVRRGLVDTFLEEEIADIIIRCLDFSAGMGFDIDSAVAKKLEVNKNRPYRHGKLI